MKTLDAEQRGPGARKHRFHIPQGVRYFDGNSLGLMPASAAAAATQVVTVDWAEGAIRSWNDAGWRTLPQRCGEKIARLVGAAPGQTVACDSTSVNLYKVLVCAVRMRPGRARIVADAGSFPTDLYIVDQVARQFGLEVERVAARDIASALKSDVALAVLTHVDYRSAEVYDMAGHTRAAHDAGALIVWDLSHTAGAIPCELDACGVDFAVGCGYKYLNGGPGAPAYVYAARRHHHECDQPLTGWFGHARPFEFEDRYAPAPGAERFLCGTSPVVALALLHDALDAFDGTSMTDLQEQSRLLTQAFIAGIDQRLAHCGFELASPRSPGLRGSHVSLRHPNGYAIMRDLARRGLIGDFRTPDFMRFGFAPLYNTLEDVAALLQALDDAMVQGTWRAIEQETKQAFT